MKTYDNGSFYTVTFNSDDAQAFSDQWPCSTVRGKGSFQFQKSNGDLVDATGAARNGDGSDWLAFSQDCQEHGKRQLAAIEKAKARKSAIPLREASQAFLDEYDHKFGKLISGDTAFAKAYFALRNSINFSR